jgi:hypothetical protein
VRVFQFVYVCACACVRVCGCACAACVRACVWLCVHRCVHGCDHWLCQSWSSQSLLNFKIDGTSSQLFEGVDYSNEAKRAREKELAKMRALELVNDVSGVCCCSALCIGGSSAAVGGGLGDGWVDGCVRVYVCV